MRVLVFIPTWKRSEITELCFISLERLRKHAATLGYELVPFVVCSDQLNAELALDFNYEIFFYKNDPFGEKKNAGIEEALKLDFDYVMELNSDGIMTNYLFDLYDTYFGKHPFFGVRTLHFFDVKTKRAKRFQYAMTDIIGSGRCYSREMIEDVIEKRGTLWHYRLNKGLDQNGLHNANKSGWFHKQVDPGGKVGLIDVKSEVNIWSFDFFRSVPDCDAKIVLDALEEDERECLLSL